MEGGRKEARKVDKCRRKDTRRREEEGGGRGNRNEARMWDKGKRREAKKMDQGKRKDAGRREEEGIGMKQECGTKWKRMRGKRKLD